MDRARGENGGKTNLGCPVGGDSLGRTKWHVLPDRDPAVPVTSDEGLPHHTRGEGWRGGRVEQGATSGLTRVPPGEAVMSSHARPPTRIEPSANSPHPHHLCLLCLVCQPGPIPNLIRKCVIEREQSLREQLQGQSHFISYSRQCSGTVNGHFTGEKTGWCGRWEGLVGLLG